MAPDKLNKRIRLAGRKIYKHTGLVNPMKKGQLSLTRILKDVKYLKEAINAEKKQFKLNGQLIRVGQTIGNVNGFYAFDVTPLPAQGTTSETRNGNSIKLSSSYYRFQISQNSATTNPIKFKLRLDLVKGQPRDVGTWVSSTKDINPFMSGSVYDYNSNQNIDVIKQYTKVFERKYVIKQDSITGGNQILNIDIPIKYFQGNGTHVKYLTDGTTNVATGQMILSMVVDNGNASDTAITNAITGGPLNSLAVNTGLFMSYNIIHYFYDN